MFSRFPTLRFFFPSFPYSHLLNSTRVIFYTISGIVKNTASYGPDERPATRSTTTSHTRRSVSKIISVIDTADCQTKTVASPEAEATGIAPDALLPFTPHLPFEDVLLYLVAKQSTNRVKGVSGGTLNFQWPLQHSVPNYSDVQIQIASAFTDFQKITGSVLHVRTTAVPVEHLKEVLKPRKT